MSNINRQDNLIGILKTSNIPVSGTALANHFHVSRQIIVRDISTLRRKGYDIISTTKGYLLQGTPSLKRILWVRHSDAQIEEELSLIIHNGGTVLDVAIYHEVYGILKAPLYIATDAQIDDFLESLANRSASPLKNLTGDYHAHTVEVPDLHAWNMIIDALKEKKMLLPKDSIPHVFLS